MSSLSKQFSNFSIYDVRKAARTAQNSLFASNSSPIELLVRQATNTDSWGPLTSQLEEIKTQMIYHDASVETFGVLFKRIIEYLGAERGIASGGKQTFYHKAVHYVNSGSEWRIIFKSLKVIEYILLHSDIGEYDQLVQQHRTILQRVQEVYEIPEGSDSTVTAAGLEKREHSKLILKTIDEIYELLEDEEYRAKEVAKSMKTQSLDAAGNNVVKLKQKHNDKLGGFNKSKQMNPSKIQNSNAKSEARNYVSHLIHTKKRLPGAYSEFGNNDLLNNSDDLNYDTDEPYDAPYDDFFVDDEPNISKSRHFKDDTPQVSEHDDDKEQEQEAQGDEEDDEFGDFQVSTSPQDHHHEPVSKSKENESLLLSLDEPVTPTTGTISTFDSFMSASTSPTTQFSIPRKSEPKVNIGNKPKDTFADLFQNAKSPK